MLLPRWDRALIDVEFDPFRGSARSIVREHARTDSEPVSGFAAFERSMLGRRTPFAVYRVGSALFFSAGDRRWRLDGGRISLGHHRVLPFASVFLVRRGARVLFLFAYSHWRRLIWSLRDPTYNGIDADTDYFLDFIARNGDQLDWQVGVLKLWSDSSTG